MLKVSFTFADHEANEFVDLGETELGPEATVRTFFEGLAAVPDPGDCAPNNFLADLRSDDDTIVDDRMVSRETVAAHLDCSVDEAIERGRVHNREIEEQLRNRRPKRTA